MSARFLKWAGFTGMALSTLVAAVFIVGETFTDPGGWKAAGLVAAWALPLAVLAALAWYRPGWAVPVFAVMTVAVIGVSIWLAVSPRGKGPADVILTFALAAAIAVLGLKRTGVAGVLLLIVGIVPFAVSTLVRGHGGFGSLAAVSFVPVVAGILYLLSAGTKGGRPAPSARTGTGTAELRNRRRRHDRAGLAPGPGSAGAHPAQSAGRPVLPQTGRRTLVTRWRGRRPWSELDVLCATDSPPGTAVDRDRVGVRRHAAPGSTVTLRRRPSFRARSRLIGAILQSSSLIVKAAQHGLICCLP